SPFMGKSDASLGEPDFWTQPWFWEILKQVLAGLFILLLIFGVIRPTIKSLANRGRDEASVMLEELEDAVAGLDDEKVTLAGMDEFLLPGASERSERQLDAQKGPIGEDPARVGQEVTCGVNDDHGKRNTAGTGSPGAAIPPGSRRHSVDESGRKRRRRDSQAHGPERSTAGRYGHGDAYQR